MKEFISEVTHRHVTAVHYRNKKKYMIWYYIENNPMKTIGIIEVRGLKEPLPETELKHHIDKVWERYERSKK